LWQDKHELNPVRPLPQGYIMVKVLDADGKPISDATVAIMRHGVTDVIKTKGWLDDFLGNYRMTATLGTYSLRVTHQDFPSDTIHKLGLGGEFPNSNFDPTSFLFTFQLSGKPPSPPPAGTSDPTVPDTPAPTPPTDPVPPEAVVDPMPPPVAHNDAASLGIKISPYTPDVFCTVESIHHVTKNDHLAAGMLFLDVVDENDRRIFNAVVLLKNKAGDHLRVLIEKPVSEPGGNMPLWAGDEYTIVGIELNDMQLPADLVTGLRSDIPNAGDGHSFVVIYKRRQAPSTLP